MSVTASLPCPPVLLLVFNRPDLAREVFQAVRAARPSRLFIAGDGPRADRPGEAELCEQCWSLAREVDWPCVVETRFLTTNAGCKMAVSGAITWFFEQVEEGIILEDDCLPHPSFFLYCAAMLRLYRDDERVGMISGNTYLPPEEWKSEGHDFSVYALIWGWATWRRAWRRFDGELVSWPRRRARGWLRGVLGGEYAASYCAVFYDSCYAGRLNSWAFPWMYSCWRSGLLSAMPACNLVTNIGFDERGTHTTDANSRNARIPTREIAVPVASVPVRANPARDQRYLNWVFDLGKFAPKAPGKKRLKIVLRETLSRFGVGWDALLLKTLPGRRAQRKRRVRMLKAAERFRPGEALVDGVLWRYPDAVNFAHDYERIFLQGLYNFTAASLAGRIIDCGANLGLASVYFQNRYPAAKVVALEADPRMCEYLRGNLGRAGVESGVTVLNKALGISTGEILFDSEDPESGAFEVVRVETVSLKDLVGDEEVDFLRIDIGGRERRLLIGQEESLGKVHRIHVEYHPHGDHAQSLAELLATLRRAGFRVHLHSEAASQRPFEWWSDEVSMNHRLNVFGFRQ